MPRSGSYIEPRTIRAASWLLGFVGIVAAVAGPAYAINAATRAPATVEVAVQLKAWPGGETPADGSTARYTDLPVQGLSESTQVRVLNDSSSVQLSAWDSTVVEQLLSRGDVAVFGLAIALGALLLRPVLNSLAAGRPFVGGNARRLAALSAVVASALLVGPLVPQVASLLVLDRLDLIGTSTPFVVRLDLPLTPALLVAVLLAILAEAFRQGERLHHDVEGLV